MPTKASYARRIDRGVCVNCASPLDRVGAYCRRCADNRNEYIRSVRVRDKAAAFEAYGGPVCACCGEDGPMFLTIDHVNGRKTERNVHLYSTLRRRGYPQDLDL